MKEFLPEPLKPMDQAVQRKWTKISNEGLNDKKQEPDQSDFIKDIVGE